MKIPPANLYPKLSTNACLQLLQLKAKPTLRDLGEAHSGFCSEIKDHILVIHSGRGDSELGLAAGAASEVAPSGNGAQATSAKAVKGAWATWATSSMR